MGGDIWFNAYMSELGLNLLSPGRKPMPAEILEVRELVADDLLALAENRKTPVPTLSRISERHHAVARYLAQGMPESVVAAITGLKVVRVSQLKNDPFFASLLARYRENADEQLDALMDSLRGLSGDALDELTRRLEEAPDGFDNTELTNLAKLTLDRAGYAPVRRSEAIVATTNMADLLEAGRRRALDAKRGVTVDG